MLNKERQENEVKVSREVVMARESNKLRDEQKAYVKQIYDVQKQTEKLHLENETLKQKNVELMYVIDVVKQNPEIV